MSGSGLPEGPGQDSLGTRSVIGFLWMFGQTVGARLLTALGQIVLARLLSPDDFGRVGMAHTIGAVGVLFVAPGLEELLVQRSSAFRRWANPAFWMSLTLGAVGALLMLALVPLAERAWNAQGLQPLVGVLAVNAVITALHTLPVARLRASLQFKVIAATGVMAASLHVLLSMGFAYTGFGALGFVLPLPLVGLWRLGRLWRLTRPPIRWRLQLLRWRQLLPDTTSIFVGRAMGTAINYGDYLVLGVVASAQEVGFYYFAYNLSRQLILVFATNMSSVLLPALTALRSDPEEQLRAALKSAKMLAFFTVPLCLGQAAVADLLIAFFFGERWLPASPMMALLMLGNAFYAASWMNANLLQANGRNALVLRIQTVQLVTFLMVVPAGASLAEGTGVASGVAIVLTVGSLYGLWLAVSVSGGSMKDVLGIYFLPFVASLTSIGGALGGDYALSTLLGLKLHALVRLGIVVGLSVPGYALLVRAWAPDAWAEVFLVARKLARRGKPA